MRRLALLLVLVLLTIPAMAQTPTAIVRGTVADEKGAVIPGTKITLTSETTGISKTAQTDQAGRYEIPFVDPGNYDVTATASGFQTTKQTGITVELFQARPVDFALKVGGVNEQIQVNAETTPPLDTTTSNTGQVVSTKMVTDLPLAGRSAFDLASLVPGVNTTGNAGTPHISGSRNAVNEQQIDGMSNIVPSNAGSVTLSAYNPVVDSVQEVSVQTSVLPAEYGRFGGGLVSVVTKSGGNQLHGTVFTFAQNAIFNARDYFLPKTSIKPDSHNYRVGGTVGGPIRIPYLYDGRKRSFFFFAYENSHSATSNVVTSTVPLPAFKKGDFSALPVAIYDPLTTDAVTHIRTPFPGNIIPAPRFSTVGKNVLSYFPDPNSGAPGLLNFNRVDAGVTPATYYHWDSRIDHDVMSRWHTFFRLSHSYSQATPFRAYGENNIASPGARQNHGSAWSLSANNIVTFSPTLFAELRYGYVNYRFFNTSFFKPLDLTSLGFPAYVQQQAATTKTGVFPQFGFLAYSQVGLNGFSIINTPTHGHDFVGSVVKIAGAHSLKFGGDYRLLYITDVHWGTPTGNYNSDRLWTQKNTTVPDGTGDAIASLLLGLPTGGQMSHDATTTMPNSYLAVYGQDTWRATRSLTLNLGLRWEVEMPKTEDRNQLAYWDNTAPSPLGVVADPTGYCLQCSNLKGQMRFVATPGAKYGRRQVPTQWKSFSPRIGLAYSPNEHLALRGGFGIAYAPSPFSGASASGGGGVQGFSGRTTFNSTFDNLGNIVTSVDNPFPSGFNLPKGAAGGPTTAVGDSIYDNFFNSVRAPYTEQWNLNVQTALPGKTTVEVAYLGSHGVFLPNGDAGQAFNQLDPSYLSLGSQLNAQVPNPFYGIITLPGSGLARPTLSRNYLMRPYPQYQQIVSYLKPVAASLYHAVALRADKRFSNGLTFLVSFTGSKLMDNSSTSVNFLGPASGTTGDAYHPRWEWTVSAQDVSRTFVTGFSYELPFGRGRKFLNSSPALVNTLVGGWQAAGVVSYYTGTPVIVGAANDQTALLSGIGKRPAWNGKSAKLSHPTRAMWFDTSAFTQPANYVIGNAPRTLGNVRTPDSFTPNLAVFKNNRWGSKENYNLQFRFETFNTTNHPHFNAPIFNVNVPAQNGKVTSAYGVRTAQLSLKFVY